MTDTFWTTIASQHEALQSAETVDEVLTICPQIPGLSSGDGFFEGSGGDLTVLEALVDVAGWKLYRFRAMYYWVARAPNGDLLTYVEGDLYRGDRIGDDG